MGKHQITFLALIMFDRKDLEARFKEHNFTDYKWIDPKIIVVSSWVRMKCQYGCDEYGVTAVCPPNVPSVSDCEKFFKEYKEPKSKKRLTSFNVGKG